MTEKLYYTKPHLSTFDATVQSCRKTSDGLFELIFDQTAFFPEGGGQPSDKGFITYDGTRFEVIYLYEKNEEVIHTVAAQIPVGARIEGTIDYELRFRRMQNHSGEHIISGIAHALYGCNNVGFHMGSDEITLDFDKELDQNQLTNIESVANEAVYKNIRLITKFPTPEELSHIDYRSKKELSGTVRLVYVEDYDICACCAPHVERSGEIGIIKILGAMKYKGGVRLRILCGMDALEHYRSSLESIKSISVLLSAKQNEIYPAVKYLSSELALERAKTDKVRERLALCMLESLKATEGNIVIFDDMLENASRRALANGGAEKCSGICAVFTPNDSGFSYVMASVHVDLRSVSKQINADLCGRGGGSATMISGSTPLTRGQIEKIFGEKNYG